MWDEYGEGHIIVGRVERGAFDGGTSKGRDK